MPPQPVPALLAIEPYKGGESKLPGFEKPVKLASNENPLGASPLAMAAFRAASASLNLYPEGSAAILREAIAQRYNLDAARIVCGAGSDEIFQLLVKAYLLPGDEIVTNQYAFSIYGILTRQAGGVVRQSVDADYKADVDSLLAQVGPRTKILFLANPNNPTGTYLTSAEIARLHAGLPKHVLFVLDAAYAEFVRADDYDNGLRLADSAENVLVTRTFSKIYGLAALRVGWGYGAADIISAIMRAKMPFNVSIPAQRAGAAAIADVAFEEQSVAHNASELPKVTEALRAIGLEVTPSVGNFVLVHFPDQDGKRASDADAYLRKNGYILRRMDGYGLPNALRFSIGAVEENKGALGALTVFMMQ
jgi:histidinol-phosphate aminotransferase